VRDTPTAALAVSPQLFHSDGCFEPVLETLRPESATRKPSAMASPRAPHTDSSPSDASANSFDVERARSAPNWNGVANPFDAPTGSAGAGFPPQAPGPEYAGAAFQSTQRALNQKALPGPVWLWPLIGVFAVGGLGFLVTRGSSPKPAAPPPTPPPVAAAAPAPAPAPTPAPEGAAADTANADKPANDDKAEPASDAPADKPADKAEATSDSDQAATEAAADAKHSGKKKKGKAHKTAKKHAP
jgi:hypothetical protein